MPVLFEDPDFRVSQGWFTSWRVLDKSTGATIIPTARIQEQIGFAWKLVRQRPLPPQMRRACEDDLFRRFAIASVDPNGIEAAIFCGFSADALALDVIQARQSEYPD
ncbi:hypothetical protein [Pararhodobacter sp.]|uniref:hypothetical protein n=1 Tax=Pararhodobacter sp. TaxID=2127056 RepID=UPI002FDDD856